MRVTLQIQAFQCASLDECAAALWRCIGSLCRSLAPGPCGPSPRDAGQEFMKASQVQTHIHMRSQTLKSDRGLNLEPSTTSNINKPMENLMCLRVQLSKVIKNYMFLKVQTLNFDRGLSFEIAKRSSPIGGLNFEEICPVPRIPAIPVIPVLPVLPTKRSKLCGSQLLQHAPGVMMTVV